MFFSTVYKVVIGFFLCTRVRALIYCLWRHVNEQSHGLVVIARRVYAGSGALGHDNPCYSLVNKRRPLAGHLIKDPPL